MLLLLLAHCCYAYVPTPLLRPLPATLLRATDTTMMPIGVPKVWPSVHARCATSPQLICTLRAPR